MYMHRKLTNVSQNHASQMFPGKTVNKSIEMDCHRLIDV